MIEVKNLVKHYTINKSGSGILGFIKGEKTVVKAIDSISFNVMKGEIVALLGANGAGKSTTIKMLTGILAPSEGTLIVNGYIPSKRKVEFLRSIGLMMGNRSSLIYDLPIKDSFIYLKQLYQIKQVSERFESFIDKLNMRDLLNTPVRKLSLGQRKKAEILATLIHEPQIVFLDEPTIGLDVQSKKEVLNFISNLAKEDKTTIVITSHDLNDVEKICKRMIYIDKGRIAYDGAVQDFASMSNTRKVTVTFEQAPKDDKKFENFSFTKDSALDYVFMVERSQISELVNLLNDETVFEYLIQRVTLEDQVLKYVEPN